MRYSRKSKPTPTPRPPPPTEAEIDAAITEAGAVFLDAFSAASALHQEIKAVASTRAELARFREELSRRVREFEELRGRVETLAGMANQGYLRHEVRRLRRHAEEWRRAAMRRGHPGVHPGNNEAGRRW